ncbi:TonB-dependent receptor [Polaribacter dokdonensis]|uniref:Iron complex outermembrane recepter protein n=1 Tax=Polaribacter dokdonensis DSW-5 TaxID=1300348 RepID=A0A0M9CI59_9FLAO|nr:TonB-dependent receptor [Polaribacter dokdonensis]KOY52455.1 TonB dependent/ligand-gated channel [Polaribacter dokdonensis DSW-5]SEE45835.1 iron complex outermembrane recepter protein [Polaribacter dokdonensis DSW-5]
MQKLFIFCVFIWCINHINAQDCNYTFKGKITDFHDNSIIVGASVQIINTNKFTSSNLEGEFMFNNLCEGKLTLEIKHVACDTKRVSYNLTKNTFKEISLEHHLEELKEVVVKTNTKTEITSIEKSLKKEVITQFTDKSLGDALNTISGVTSLNTGNSIVKPMIHGLHSSRLLIINNNVRMFDQEWGDEHAPNIDINSSDRIDVIKGANSLRYGSDAVGGLILIRPKKYAIIDSLFGSTTTSLNSNGFGGNVNTEIVKTFKSGYYTKLQGNYKRFGDFRAPNYYLTNTGIQSINGSFRVGYNSYEKGFDAYYSFVNNKIGILRSSHIGNVSDLVEAINNREPRIVEDFSYDINFPRQNIFHHLAKVEAFKRYKNLGKLSIQLDAQLNRRKEFDLRRGDLRNRPVIDLQLFTTSIQPNLEINKFEDFKINTGLLVRYQNNDAIVNTGANTLIPDYNKYELGTYAILDYNLNETSELSFGVRYDYSKIKARKWYVESDWTALNYDVLFPEFDTGITDGLELLTRPEFTFNNFSTNVGYSKRFGDAYAFLFNYGLSQRMPNPSELFSGGLHHSAARIEFGFLTINKETANKFIMTLERNNKNFGFSISPYYKQIDGFIQLIPTGIKTTIRGAFPVWEYNQVNARIFGVDIDINKEITKNFDYKGSLSLLQGDDLTNNNPLIHMPSANFSNKITYTNNDFHQLKIGVSQRTTLQQNRFPDFNFTTFNPVTQQQVFVDISSTPPSYTLYGFNSSAVFYPFKKGSMEVGFNIDNLFNVSYRENLNRLRYFADDLGRNYNLKIKLNY